MGGGVERASKLPKEISCICNYLYFPEKNMQVLHMRSCKSIDCVIGPQTWVALSQEIRQFGREHLIGHHVICVELFHICLSSCYPALM